MTRKCERQTVEVREGGSRVVDKDGNEVKKTTAKKKVTSKKPEGKANAN